MGRVVKCTSPYLNNRQRLSIVGDRLFSFNYQRGEFSETVELGNGGRNSVEQEIANCLAAGIEQFDIVNPMYNMGPGNCDTFLWVVAKELAEAFPAHWPGRIHCVQEIDQILGMVDSCEEVVKTQSRIDGHARSLCLTTGGLWADEKDPGELDIMQGEPRNNHDESALVAMCLYSYLFLSEDYMVNPEGDLKHLGMQFYQGEYKFMFDYKSKVADIVEPYNCYLFSVDSPYLASRYYCEHKGMQYLEDLMGIPKAGRGLGEKLLKYANRFNAELKAGLIDYVAEVREQIEQNMQNKVEQPNGYLRLMYKYCSSLLADGCYIAGIAGDEILVASSVHTHSVGKSIEAMQKANEAAGNAFSRPQLWVDPDLAEEDEAKYIVAMAEAAGPSILS